MRFVAGCALALTAVPIIFLSGCAFGPAAGPMAMPGVALRGMVHGGQQPVIGAHVYLFAANVTANAGPGIAASTANASTPLLLAQNTGLSDSIGPYVLTGSDGGFTIAGDYSCTSNTQVYLYVKGGNTGAGTNSASGMMAVLGNCPASQNFAATEPFIWVNEVSTVAAAFAMSGYATDATHVSSSGTALGTQGIAQAFANAANLVNLATGTARTTTPNGAGAVPQATIDTIADVLAACVNANDVNPGNCSTLFANTVADSVTPSETATAAIHLAHQPSANMTALYGLTAAGAAFAPALSSQPIDFSVSLRFTGGLVNPSLVAIDGSGNVWVTGDQSGTLNHSTLSKFGPDGSTLNSAVFGDYGPKRIAIAPNGDVWVVKYESTTGNGNSGGLARFNSSGALVTDFIAASSSANPGDAVFDSSGNLWMLNYGGTSHTGSICKITESTGAVGTCTPGAVSFPAESAIDTSNNLWIAYAEGTIGIYPLTNGTLSGTTFGGSYANGVFEPSGAAIDASGDFWITDSNGVSKYLPNHTAGTGSPFDPVSLNAPSNVVLDGANHVWTASAAVISGGGFLGGTIVYPEFLVELSSTGASLTPEGFANSGFSATSTVATQVAIDGAGNLWVPDETAETLVEFVGIAAPVVTPIAANLRTPYGAYTVNRP